MVLETRKHKPNPGVVAFLRSADPKAVYLSEITLAEVREALAELKQQPHRPADIDRLTVWLDVLESRFADRILPVGAGASNLWAKWPARSKRAVQASFIAATAAHHDLTVVTHRVQAIANLPVHILNPWQI